MPAADPRAPVDAPAPPPGALRGLAPLPLLRALEARFRGRDRDRHADAAQTPEVWTGLAFRLREHWLLAPGEEIREITSRPRLTRVPGARAWLLGVGNLRGALLPVTDVGALLGQPPAGDGRDQRVLVLAQDGIAAGLLVDEVAGYRRFTPAEQRPAVTGPASFAPWRLGGFHRDGRDWLAVSLRRLARSERFTQAAR